MRLDYQGYLVLKLPSWFPGMSFKRDMATAKAFSKQYVERPFQYSLERLVREYLEISTRIHCRVSLQIALFPVWYSMLSEMWKRKAP